MATDTSATPATPAPSPPATSQVPAASKPTVPFVPGPSIPAEPPAPNPEFNPDFEPPVTHDLRTNRPEAEHLQELMPVDPKSEAPGMDTGLVTIPAVRLRQLEAQALLNMLAVDFPQSAVPTEEALRIAKIFREGVDGILPQERAASPESHVHAIQAIQKPAETKPRKMSATNLTILVALVAAFSSVAFVLGRKEGVKTGALTGEVNPGHRLVFPMIGGFNMQVYQGLRVMDPTHGRIVWVTTDPLNPYLWNIFGQVSQKGTKVTVVAVGPNIPVTEIRNFAMVKGVDLYHSPIRVDRCNLVQIDRSLQIDGSNDTVTYSSTDSNDIDRWTATVGKEIYSNARVVHQVPRAAQR